MKSKKNSERELTAEGCTQVEVKIQRGILQRNSLSPLLFVIARTLNYILRQYTGGFNFTKSQEKIDYFMYMDEMKLFAKKGKTTGDFDTN